MLNKYSVLDMHLKILIIFIAIVYCIGTCTGHEFESHENKTLEIVRNKRSTTTYKCWSKKCSNGICAPSKYYEGANPPAWCGNLQPHRSQTKCKWSQSCLGSECKMESNCDKQYDDLKHGQRMTLKFKCYTETCGVSQCQGGSCYVKNNISKSDFEQKYIKALPRCKDVEGRRGRRKRSLGAVQGFIGYCCDISTKWGGMIFGIVRPIRR